MSYDTEPCEGWQASPSNPSSAPAKGEGAKANAAARSSVIVLRCTPAEKLAVGASAYAAGVSVSALMRETLGLVRARRRKPVPRADPALIVAVARIGSNLNQIARAVNRAATASGKGGATLDTLAVAVRLVSIERALVALLDMHSAARVQSPSIDEGGDAD